MTGTNKIDLCFQNLVDTLGLPSIDGHLDPLLEKRILHLQHGPFQGEDPFFSRLVGEVDKNGNPILGNMFLLENRILHNNADLQHIFEGVVNEGGP